MILFLKIQKTQKKAKILLKILKNIMTNLATLLPKRYFQRENSERCTALPYMVTTEMIA